MTEEEQQNKELSRELENMYQKQIQKLKEDKQTEIDKYQAKYFELLEQQNKTKRTKASSTNE